MNVISNNLFVKVISETSTEQKKRGKGRVNRDVVVFSFFLFLSFIFWYLNSMGKEVEAGIKYPVAYSNSANEKTVVVKAESEFNLYLRGTGFSIMQTKFRKKNNPLIIDISESNYRRVSGSKDPDYYLVTSGLIKSLNLQLRSGCEITSIKPDTIFFTLRRTGAESDNNSPGKIVSGNINK